VAYNSGEENLDERSGDFSKCLTIPVQLTKILVRPGLSGVSKIASSIMVRGRIPYRKFYNPGQYEHRQIRFITKGDGYTWTDPSPHIPVFLKPGHFLK
jgi:hypothetical protein